MKKWYEYKNSFTTAILWAINLFKHHSIPGNFMYIISRNNWILINPITILELIRVVQVDYCRQHKEGKVLSFMSLGWILPMPLSNHRMLETFSRSLRLLRILCHNCCYDDSQRSWKCSVACLTHLHTAYGNTEWYNSVEGNFKFVHVNHTYILSQRVLQWFFRGLRLNAKAHFALVSIE